ncbi:beta-fructofuranosidase [Treponema bryantii]|uniref:Sucrose-6-phosphate hydrolase n=1 Tax=Treponema bryantii TaxID=163 RepID=A0A1I3JMV2_9SPIR|nr:glycoside hydrolase family 32 protein [Treponema bryantii]SFI61573.1 beta-fructofuranosidase [Treponema bryantii]
MKTSLKRARKYEAENNNSYLKDRPAFHFTPYIGWMNDPNGFSFYKGQFHLFYQYYPYGLGWNSMHWGHAVSKDLLHWEYLPAALAPENKYDSFGVFSGSSIELPDGQQLLMYTGVTKNNDKDTQLQCVATGDGINYKKFAGNPVIGKNLFPEGFNSQHFRDPKIWRAADGSYYCISVSCKNDGNGAILLFHSPDAFSWSYEGVLLENKGNIGKMWECPDYFELDGKDIILISPQNMLPQQDKYMAGSRTAYFCGKFDLEQKKFIPDFDAPVDSGIDFYASQTVKAPDGRTILIGWMQNWDTCNLTDRGNRNWFGQMSTPRELSLKDGKLIQKPVKEIESYRTASTTLNDVTVDGDFLPENLTGRIIDMELTIRPKENKSLNSFTINLAQSEEYKITLEYKADSHTLVFDRSKTEMRNALCSQSICRVSDSQELKLRILLDTYSAEVFVNDGQQVMTNTFYIEPSAKTISFNSVGSAVVNITKYDLHF